MIGAAKAQAAEAAAVSQPISTGSPATAAACSAANPARTVDQAKDQAAVGTTAASTAAAIVVNPAATMPSGMRVIEFNKTAN